MAQTYRFDNHGLDALLFTLLLHLLRRLDSIVVVDGDVASFLCKCY